MHCSEVCVFWCRHNLICASLLNTYEEPLISQCRHPKLPPLQLPPHCHDLSFGENILWKSVSVVSTFFCKGIINLPDLQVRGQSGASSGSSHRTREREFCHAPVHRPRYLVLGARQVHVQLPSAGALQWPSGLPLPWGSMLSGAGAGCGERGMPPNQFHSLSQGPPPGPSTLLSPGHLSHLNPDSWLEAWAAHHPVVAHSCGPSV